MTAINVLVTGSSGFIGTALLDRLASDNFFNVIGVVRTSDEKSFKNVSLVEIQNISPKTNWSEALKNIDVVVHLAARVHILKESVSDSIAAYRSMNVDSTLNLARQALNSGVKRFIYLSSIKVNGEFTLPGSPYSEAISQPPEDPYGLSKYEAEIQLRELTKNSSMEVVIIRPPLVYGPGVKANFKSMMDWLDKGVPLPLGAIKNKRSLVSVENLADFIVVSLSHPLAANETFLVSDGDDLSTTQLLRFLAQGLDRSVYLIPVPMWLIKFVFRLLGKNAISQRLCGSLQVDINKAKTLLNWRPPLTVKVALEKTAKHFLRDKGH